MKKFWIAGALALSTFVFANTKENGSNEIKSAEIISSYEVKPDSVTNGGGDLVLYTKEVYSKCGKIVSVQFYSVSYDQEFGADGWTTEEYAQYQYDFNRAKNLALLKENTKCTPQETLAWSLEQFNSGNSGSTVNN